MQLDKIYKKIIIDFQKGNFKQNYYDLIKIYKTNKNSDIANKLGVVFTKLNKQIFADYFFKKSIELDERNYKAYFNLANLNKLIDINEAKKNINKALEIKPTVEARILKSYFLINEYKYEEAINLIIKIQSPESHYLLGVCYLAIGNEIESKLNLEKSLLFENINFNFLNLNTFPRVYKNTKQLNYFRKRFESIISKLNKSILSKNLSKQEKLNIINSRSNFFLAYQQKNDLELNKKYYKLLENIYSANEVKDEYKFNKNKILFVSGFFYKHTVSKFFFNFVEEFSKINHLNVHLLHLSKIKDDWTEMYLNLNVKFYSETEFVKIYRYLKRENFGSIIFLDHGMNNLSQSIINTKFAKNYFMLWGHPITTGSKNVDYFISSELMDKNNQNNYSEKLVLIKGIGFNYKLDKNLLTYEKKISKIKQNSFYIPQGIFKFLPKYDHIIGEILNQNNNSTISFIKDKDPYFTKIFIERLKKNKKIKNNFDRLIFYNGSSKNFNFLEKLNAHKIILDTIGWSGGNTSIEAIFLNKPIITLQGNNLRSNHTAALLKFLDLEILIANSYIDYLALAKKINNDDVFYKSVTNKIKLNKKKLIENKISLFKHIENYL